MAAQTYPLLGIGQKPTKNTYYVEQLPWGPWAVISRDTGAVIDTQRSRLLADGTARIMNGETR